MLTEVLDDLEEGESRWRTSKMMRVLELLEEVGWMVNHLATLQDLKMVGKAYMEEVSGVLRPKNRLRH